MINTILKSLLKSYSSFYNFKVIFFLIQGCYEFFSTIFILPRVVKLENCGILTDLVVKINDHEIGALILTLSGNGKQLAYVGLLNSTKFFESTHQTNSSAGTSLSFTNWVYATTSAHCFGESS